LLLSSIDAFVDNLFDFKLFFAINQLRGWLMIVYAVFFCFMIWGQKINVKHIMNLERRRKFEAVCDG
jgi:hypothetical protein